MPYKDKIKQQEAQHKNYLKYKEKYKESLSSRIARNRKFIAEYKSDKKCSRCTESRSICLHFHHRESEDKYKGISELVKNGSSIKKILAEIEKCEILCANCHLVEHYGNIWTEDSSL